MSRPIGRFESFLDWVVRFLMVMAALAVTAYIGWYGWVITTGEPISNPTADTASQGVDGAEAVAPPVSRPDTLPGDTASRSIDTTGASD